MAEEREAVPSLVSDPELASMMDTYLSLNRQREEKAKSQLQAEIERLRIELDKPVSEPTTGRCVMQRNFAAESKLHWAFTSTESRIYTHLKEITLCELVEHVPSARKHAAVLFECMDPKMIKSVVSSIEDETLDDTLSDYEKKRGWSHRNPKRENNIQYWTKLCQRRYVSTYSGDAPDAAVDEANSAARALIRWALANLEGRMDKVYTGVHLAAPTCAAGRPGSWEYRYRKIVRGWGAAARWIIVTFHDHAPRAFKAVVFPEIVWSVEVPEVLGPLACLVPHVSEFRGPDNKQLFGSGPVLAKLRALCFLLASEVDARTILLYGLDLCMDDATSQWRTSLAEKEVKQQNELCLYVTGRPGWGTSYGADMQVTWHKSSAHERNDAGYWASKMLKLETEAQWGMIRIFL